MKVNFIVTSVTDKDAPVVYEQSDDQGLFAFEGKKTAKGHMRITLSEKTSFIRESDGKRVKMNFADGLTLMPGDSILVGEKKTKEGLATGTGWGMIFVDKESIPVEVDAEIQAAASAEPKA